MNLTEFQARCMATATWRHHRKVEYPVMAMSGEAGESANLVKKVMRREEQQHPDGVLAGLTSDERAKLILEAMDTMYYAAATLFDLGVSLNDGATALFAKLDERARLGTIKDHA